MTHSTERESLFGVRKGVPRGWCLNCGHSPDSHDDEGVCEVEVSDYGNMDCSCDGLRMCAACDGDPEAQGRHVCGRKDYA